MGEFEPKVYLNQIKYIDDDIRSRQEELDRIRYSLFMKTSSLKDVSVQESQSSAFDERYIAFIDKTDSINNIIDDLVNTKIRVSNEIDLLDDRLSRIILRERYLNLKPLEEVAKSLNYEPRHFYRLHGQALLKFKDVMSCHMMS